MERQCADTRNGGRMEMEEDGLEFDVQMRAFTTARILEQCFGTFVRKAYWSILAERLYPKPPGPSLRCESYAIESI